MPSDQRSLLSFLNSLVLFPPDDTASTLDPADPTKPDFPQNGHGSIKLECYLTIQTIRNRYRNRIEAAQHKTKASAPLLSGHAI